MSSRDPPSCVPDEPGHVGVAKHDPRNWGAIAFFKPKDVTEAYVRERLSAVSKQASAADVDARIRQFMADLANKKVAPPPPLSQPVESAPDPAFGLGVHPDIVARLWRLDRALPRSCRWLVWGHPALVHPQTGVIFAVAIGTFGIVLRPPPELRDSRSSSLSSRPAHGEYDIAAAGPEWRWLGWDADDGLVLSAYAHAADA